MARIILGSYAVRYPIGGYMAMVAQWLHAFQQLGHDVYCIEKCSSPEDCYNPLEGINGDCSYGMAAVSDLLRQCGLEDKLCFVDAEGHCHGLSRGRLDQLLQSADVFVDTVKFEWRAEAEHVKLRVVVDSDPGISQMQMANAIAAGESLPEYDYYFTVGRNIGTSKSTAPTAGKPWRPLFPPVSLDLFPYQPVCGDAAFTTIMSWRMHRRVEFNGQAYGGKDIEFGKFIDLPRRTDVPLEIAVDGGRSLPGQRLLDCGWRVRNSYDVSMSVESFRQYLSQSQGEFSVSKNVYVATHTGWFSDRSAAYLATGRPVVLQDTGFSEHLPCGRGLFAVRTADEAAAAIEDIRGNYQRHCIWAHEIAAEYLSAPKVLGGMLRELGISS
jgi:hypothetical protein